jgi:riboflavin-specific deaminase-like protein
MKFRQKKSRPLIAPKNRSFVAINMAMTADGKTATANRRDSKFGSSGDLAHLYALRATADAVMTGAGTINAQPDIKLGPGGARFQRRRLRAGLAEFNLRILVSGSGHVNLDAEIFSHRFSPLIILTTKSVGATRLRALRKKADAVKICGAKKINFTRALRWLRDEWNVHRLLCEGGGELNDALFREDLVDEINLTLCPRIVGGRTAPTIADGVGAARLADARDFKITSARRVGEELFLVLHRAARKS